MQSNNRVLFPSAALLLALAPLSAFAQAPSAAPGREKPSKHADHAASKAEKADEKAARAEARAEAKGKPGNEADASAAEPADGNGQHGRGPLHAGDGHRHGGLRALGEDFRQGRVKKPELEARLAALRDGAKERRRDHQKALEHRWGATLSNPSCREELRHHARREAFLERALYLAQTEVTKDKEKLIERIEKLMAKEDERHARAMERLKGSPPGAAPSGTPSALPSPSASAAKAGDQ